ncbi:hypothetical protein QQF64_029666 [Cirrhinus molitorella]|uniref:Uncharacterized protein n=1 Tax=Cirrhinus molitorella TaxID=172907 RepID=A0ABR3N156_9TELE
MKSSVRKIWVKINAQGKVYPFIFTDKSCSALAWFSCCETPDCVQDGLLNLSTLHAVQVTLLHLLLWVAVVRLSSLQCVPAGLSVSVLP